MPIPLLPIVAGALATAVGTFFQDRSAAIRHKNELRERELEKARVLFREVTEKLGSLLHTNEEAMFGAVTRDLRHDSKTRGPEDQDSKNWTHYQEALNDWKKTRTLLLGQLKRYFSQDVVGLFEDIYGKDLRPGSEDSKGSKVKPPGDSTGLILLERMVNVSYYGIQGHPDELSKDEKAENYYLIRYFATKDPLEKKVTDLAILMTQQIQEETIGMLDSSRGPL